MICDSSSLLTFSFQHKLFLTEANVLSAIEQLNTIHDPWVREGGREGQEE